MQGTNSVNNNLLISRTNGQQSIKDGGEALVRVIADKGNGKYLGSLGGARVTINSKNPLTVGKSFVAVVQFKNGTVVLTPKQESLSSEQLNNSQINQNHRINVLLNQMGLPENSFSLNLLQQFKQLSMKFDVDALKKLYNLSIKFKGKEKKAIQLLSDLLKKGIDVSESEIINLIKVLEDSESWEESKDEMNKLSELNGLEKGWRVYPFEMIEKLTNSVSGTGIMRLLFDDMKQLQKLNVECKYNQKKYLFSCDYENKSLKRFFVNINPYAENHIPQLLDLIKKGFTGKNIEVQWCDAALLEGTACDLETIYTFNGEL